MLKILLFVVIATAQCAELKEKLNHDLETKVQHLPGQQGHRFHGFHPRSDWSWMPSVPNFLKFEDEEELSPKILKRLEAVEKTLKELNDRMKKGSHGPKKSESPTTPSNKDKTEAPPCKETSPQATTPNPSSQKDQPQKPETVEKPETTTKAAQPTQTQENMSTAEPPAKATEAAQTDGSTQSPPPDEKEAMDPKEN